MLAQLNKEQKNFDQANKFNIKSVELITTKISGGLESIEKLPPNYISQLSSLYNIIGANFGLMGQTDKSIEYFEKSYNVGKIIYGEESEKGMNLLMNLGSAYLRLKQYQKAIDNIERALQIKQSLHLK